MTRSPSPSARRCGPLGLVIAALLLALAIQQCSAAYYGKLIGKLSQLHHGVSGEVYAVDARTLFIKDFTYDGEAPAAYFYAGTSKVVGQNGFRVRDERGTTNSLKRYRKRDITLTLPEGKTLNNIKWFSVYCEEFAVNFGDVKIPRNFDYPRPQKLGRLSGIHGVDSEPVVVVDAQTLLVPSFSYDGEAPDAKFWVGQGPSPSPQGIRVPDENGKVVPLRRYDHKTIVLTLPGDLTVHQLGHFGVWCEAFAVDFGHIQIPQQSLNVPPSLKMLGISPQSKLNCEVLEDGLAFEVRWAVAGDSIVVQLVGKLDNNQYMSFGVSADPKRSQMVGGDVVVAWVDKQSLQGYAVDYFLDAKSQCSGGRGSCPDERIQEGKNSVRLLNAAMVNGYSIVTYQRPLRADDELDRPILTNSSQAVIWAVGPLNDKSEVSFHSGYLKGDRFIEFGRPPAWNCPMPELQEQQQHQQQQRHPQQHSAKLQQLPQQQQYQDNDHRDQEGSSQVTATTRRPLRVQATPAPAPKADAWDIPPIQCNEPEDGVFYAQMGPTGGKHGYPAITGHVGWGISWYINGLLIPEIHVVRGKQYTFVTEGGEDPDVPARYHPFYITDDPVGGYQHKTPEERANVTIFSGVRRQRGVVRPTGVGRLCNWNPDQTGPPADDFSSFGAYQRTLTLVCDRGEPGFIQWTPDENTPDTVYYQCFTHRYLGWKIHVHDKCDIAAPQASASEQHEVIAEPSDLIEQETAGSDLETGASVRANPSKVTPSPEFFQRHQEYAAQDYDYLRNHHSQLHHHNHHTPQLAVATNNPNGKLITGPYLREHQLHHHNHYGNNNPPQLTHLASYAHSPPESTDEQRRSPPKLTYDAVNYIIQREASNNNDYRHHHHHLHYHPPHHHHHHHQPSAYAVQELPSDGSNPESAHGLESPNSESTSDSQYSKIVADYHHQVVRRPAALLVNQVAGAQPLRVSYPLPVHAPAASTPSILQAYTKTQTQNLRVQPPPPQMVIVQRRPTLSQQSASPSGSYFQTALRRPSSSALAAYQATGSVGHMPRQPVFYERKKAVYKPAMLSRMQTLGKQSYHHYPHYYHHSPTKLVKVDLKHQQQRAKIEAKAAQSEALSSESKSSLRPMLMKPARNTGFDPGSIVIEKGFKPILKRNFHNENDHQTEQSERTSDKSSVDRSSELLMRDEEAKETSSDRYNDSFEPVFIPSPPDRNGPKKQSKKKIQLIRTKLKLDSLDDMEMAAADRERLDMAYLYLPTVATLTKRSPKSSSAVAPTLSLNSELQSQPSINHANSTSSETVSESRSSRTKRSAQMKSENWNSEYRRDHDPDSHADSAKHDHSHDVNGHDDHDPTSHRNGHERPDQETQTSTGEIILANIEYVILTVVLYYAL